MKRVALLQFHKDWQVCANRLALLRRFNPDVPVYGLYGGEAEGLAAAREVFAGEPDAVYVMTGRDGRWKWQNTDLVVRGWHAEVGRRIPFDVVHVVQWDLLFFDSLSNIYARIPPNALGLTGITRIDAIADRWHWTRNEPHRTELGQLADLVRDRFGAEGPFQACLGPGYCLPRTFLDQYTETEVPELTHDEIRLPLFARLLGFEVADTGFYPRWFDPSGERFFNANGDEIEEAVIRSELAERHGHRVFHPFRRVFDLSGA